jgi:hypothetical protein
VQTCPLLFHNRCLLAWRNTSDNSSSNNWTTALAVEGSGWPPAAVVFHARQFHDEHLVGFEQGHQMVFVKCGKNNCKCDKIWEFFARKEALMSLG